VSPTAGWHFAAGLFTGDERADLMGYHSSNGTLWVGENTGAFNFQRWASVSPASDWQFLARDVTGTGRADAIGYYPSNGTIAGLWS
jgi:hypothetical protein